MLSSGIVGPLESALVTVPHDLELIGLVHRGAQTEIWQTRQRHTGELVCWKGLRGTREEFPTTARRLDHERRVLAEVNSQYLIPAPHAPHEQDPPGLRLPWLAGESLHSRLVRTRQVPFPYAVWIARQVAQGLQALLAAGWRHGAIAPRHVLLSPTGEVRLVDLAAAVRDELPPLALEGTAVEAAAGSACLPGGGAAGRIHDLQDLGRLVWHMLTGRPDPDCTLDSATLARELRKRAPEVPRDMALLTARLLTGENWSYGTGLREVIRPLVGHELQCLSGAMFQPENADPVFNPSAA